ncbi:hypothetical protein, partial [Gemmobacter lanyuensis]|uniref:hypothetical protein n=1 Tax=Gemmobacter lanyuensis TaxID=1054497 RepID=UPI001E568C43
GMRTDDLSLPDDMELLKAPTSAIGSVISTLLVADLPLQLAPTFGGWARGGIHAIMAAGS